MSEIVMDSHGVRLMGERIRVTGQQMPDPPGRPPSGLGSWTVDDALAATIGAVCDHLLGLGAGMVRLGHAAVDAALVMVEADAA